MQGETERLSALQDCFTLISSTICCILVLIRVCNSWANLRWAPDEMTGEESNLHCSKDCLLAFHLQIFFSYEVKEFIVDGDTYYTLHPQMALDSFGLYTCAIKPKHRHLPNPKQLQEEK